MNTRALSPSERSAFLNKFKISETLATVIMPTARVFEVASGHDVTQSDHIFMLLSGRVVQGEDDLNAPAVIIPHFHDGPAHAWEADGSTQIVALERRAVTKMLVAAVADDLPLPHFEPAISDQRALRDAVEHGQTFAGLSQTLSHALQAAMTLHHVRGGELVLQEGDPSDDLHVVVIGRLMVARKLDGQFVKLAEFGPGSVVGEVGMLVDVARTADVSTMRDTLLARLSREDFEQLLTAHPIEMTRVFARAIYSNIEGTRRAPPQVVATTTVLVPSLPRDQAEYAAESLCKAFSAFGTCLLIRKTDFVATEGGRNAIISRLSALERKVDNILILAEPEATPWTRIIARQADKFAFLVADERFPDPESFKREVLIGEPSTFVNHCIVQINAADAARPGDVLQNDGTVAENVPIYPVRTGNRTDFERTARFIAERAVGLVLGGGAARGLAHIGVLRAMEELNIPIDMIGGNSMGALIGSQYAYGIPSESLLKTTRQLFAKGDRPTFPAASLLAGKGMERGLIELFGETQIGQLWRPFFAVACSISKARVVTLDRGPLWRAVRASNSPAGLLPPIPHNGELLIDGAVLNNVPTDVMRLIIGRGRVIGVSVDKNEELMVSPDLTRVTPLSSLTSRGSPHGKRTPRITEILARAGAVGGVAARARLRPLADTWLEPPVSDYSLIAYHKAAELAEIGYNYAIQELRDG
jgi:predicted acylesterase/phospholipase RssA